MSLFKTGDATYDQYATYSTDELIQIVTNTTGSYLPGVMDTARRILLVRGFDYRTKEQKAAEKQLKAINNTRERSATTSSAFSQSRAGINRRNRPANNFGLKPWQWVWITLAIIRMIACLAKHS